MAGGESALSRATETTEDDPAIGARDLLERGFTQRDVLVGITASGRTPYVLGAVAELERSIIRERVAAGVEHARRNGTRSGKPIGRPRVVFRADLIPELPESGLSWRETARKLGVSPTIIRRAFKQCKGSDAVCNGSSALTNIPERTNNDGAMS